VRVALGAAADRPVQRFARLLAGLVLYGFSLGLLVEAALGLDPWDVFHQGLSIVTGRSIGTLVVLSSVGVLLLWLPLRQRPGPGTVLNALIVGPVLDATLALLPDAHGLPIRIALLLTAVGLNAVATALYIGAGLGPGPRDGLMTGLATRGVPIIVGRTAIEVTVLAVGWLLGGTVGVGTVLYAFGIGPMAAWLLPRLTIRARAEGPAEH
jgi:uncharacterized membrane protein YczE